MPPTAVTLPDKHRPADTPQGADQPFAGQSAQGDSGNKHTVAESGIRLFKALILQHVQGAPVGYYSFRQVNNKAHQSQDDNNPSWKNRGFPLFSGGDVVQERV